MRTIRFTIVFTLALVVAVTQSGFTQDKISGGAGGFHIGSKFYNTQNYSFFLDDGVADLDDNLRSIGGGGYIIYKNFMLGGRGFYQGGESRDVTFVDPFEGSTIYTYSVGGGGGYLNLGYVVHSAKDLLVFPQLGLGYEALVLEKALNEATSFDPGEALSTEYRWGSPMLDIAAGIDWFPFENYGAKVGLRIGYTISMQRNTDWSHSGGDFVSSTLPTNNLDGFYLNISIGGGWFSKSQ